MEFGGFTPERVEIKHKGAAVLSVRGLNLVDVKLLVQAHYEDLRHLSNLLSGALEEVFSTVQQDGFLLRLVAEVPSVAGSILALGSDNPGKEADLLKLPLGFQLRALTEIVRMTLEDVGGPKGMVALIKGAMRRTDPESQETITMSLS